MAIYHLHLSHGSRAGGQSASAKADYITRDGRYAERSGLSHTESINMPTWADSPQAFWRGADEWSRANARLFTEVEVALPAELNQAQQVELAREFAGKLTNHPDGKIPCTWAIHDADKPNPHVHLVLSSRVDDGLVRPDAQTWFSRAASGKKPAEQGGARSWAEATNKDWLEALRKTWGQSANRALERAGHQERIDHRSLAKQDEHLPELLRRAPTRHVGWAQQKRQEIRQHNERVGVTRRMQRELVTESQEYHRQVKSEQAAKADLTAKRERVARANAPTPKPTPEAQERPKAAPASTWEADTHAALAKRAKEALEALDKVRGQGWFHGRDSAMAMASEKSSAAGRALLTFEGDQKRLEPSLSPAEREARLKAMQAERERQERSKQQQRSQDGPRFTR